MKIQEMLETITAIEKRRNVSVYITYGGELGWTFKMYGRSDKAGVVLNRTIPASQMVLWNIVMFENFLNAMADGIEIGVTG